MRDEFKLVPCLVGTNEDQVEEEMMKNPVKRPARVSGTISNKQPKKTIYIPRSLKQSLEGDKCNK